MKGKLLAMAGLGMIVLLGSPSAARADLIWSFFNLNSATDGTVLASPQIATSTPAGFSLTLTAIADSTNPSNSSGVFVVRDLGVSSDDRGIGVCENGSASGAPTCAATGTLEVDGTEAIRINLPTGPSNFTLRFSSLDGGEAAHIWAGSVGGTSLGSVIGSTAGGFSSFAIPNAFDGQPIFVTADVNDFLLYGATAQVPEPGTLLLLGSGLMGLGGIAWRRKRK